MLVRADAEVLSEGVYAFNGILASVAINFFLVLSVWSKMAAVVGSAMTVVIAKAWMQGQVGTVIGF